VGGLTLSFGSFWFASLQGGGRYVVWYGAIIFGLILFLRGLLTRH
jgi:hypothetical protein